MVTCKICNKSFKAITNTHLESAHQVTVEEYKHMFPDAELTSTQTRVSLRQHQWKGCGGLSGKKFASYKNKAEQRGLDFEVTIEYLWELYSSQKGKCTLTGIELTLEAPLGDRAPVNTASLDRIDSRKGYIVGNVQWVHKDINRMKSDLPPEHFIEMCKAVSKYNTK